jgi:hypothetical protein
MSTRMTDALSRIQLGFLANGGEEWNKANCDCEPETNNAPCRYCAIHDALRAATRLLDACNIASGPTESFITTATVNQLRTRLRVIQQNASAAFAKA